MALANIGDTQPYAYTVNNQGQIVINTNVGAGAAEAPSSGGDGGGGGGGGSTAPSAPTGPQDWSSFLGIYGLPPDVQAKVNQIFGSTSDINQATALAMAYVRGTDWYKTTYPGIQEGIGKGVISNESDYRSYVNSLQQLNQQYYGTDITSQQISDYLKAGYNPTHVGQIFQGHAYAQANGNDLRYITGAFGGGQISDQDLETLGQESAGLDSAMGQKLQSAVQKAQARVNKVFSGTLATPSLSLGTTGLSSPSLAGPKATPDVAAS